MLLKIHMETTLHRQLKDLFREPNSPIEVKLGRFRIDVVNGDRLVEIQRSGLASIRSKIKKLLSEGFCIDVVKPLVARKQLVKLSRYNGVEVDRRWSPLRGTVLDVFDELMYFTEVFPHPNLKLITPLVTIEEVRFPGHGRRRRRRDGDFVVKDRHILELHETYSFSAVTDLFQVLPRNLPTEFDTRELAAGMSVPRDQAQKVAYVMRKIGGMVQIGKRGNAILCRLVTTKEAATELASKKTKTNRVATTKIRAAVAKHAAKAA